MKKMVFCLVLLALAVVPPVAAAGNPVRVDVLYMDHGPLKPTLGKLGELFSRYGGTIAVAWHDFESADGERFMAGKGMNSHVPLVIWIDGKDTVQVAGRPITFSGFPTGSGPAFFQGKWTLDSLAKALDQATGRK